jgi:DNA-binding transcriptional MerR regulator
LPEVLALDKNPDAFRTISEVADELDLPQHVLRFWETRFSQIRPVKRGGGRRYYRREDVDLLRGIRHLLYGEGYTIRGVQRILKEQGVKAVQAHAPGLPGPAASPLTRLDSEVDADSASDMEDMADAAFAEAEAGPAMAPAEEVPPARPVSRPPAPAVPTPLMAMPAPPVPWPTAPAVAAPVPAARMRPAGPSLPDPPAPADAMASPLSRDDIRRLQAALFDLAECRKLLTGNG